jgi:diaminopimelate epimerase
MDIPFEKYHGTGNDFVLIDNRSGFFPVNDVLLIKKLCNRHFGVGSDGLILIEPGVGTHFFMNFFNPDASQSFCGNGSRCAVRFAKALGIFDDECVFGAIDGEHSAVLNSDHSVRVRMRDVIQILDIDGDAFIDTGSPHYLVMSHNVNELDLLADARKIRYSPAYAEHGVNVNFVEVLTEGHIRMRTYERGVEDETLSCGTGVTAAALFYARKTGFSGEVKVATRGGELRVKSDLQEGGGYSNIWLIGPAEPVFTGNYFSN